MSAVLLLGSSVALDVRAQVPWLRPRLHFLSDIVVSKTANKILN